MSHDESQALYAQAKEAREQVIIPGMGHFDWAMPSDPRFDRVMQNLSRWFQDHLMAV